MKYMQIFKNIAAILNDERNARKLEQFMTAYDITEHITSDGGCDIKAELYNGNIVRYIITGTRSNVTITANTITCEIVRKKRNEKPWQVVEFHANFEDIAQLINIPEYFVVKCYDKFGNMEKEVKTNTLKEAETIRTNHGLSIGLEPEPTYKDFCRYPTIWRFTTEKGLERLLGY